MTCTDPLNSPYSWDAPDADPPQRLVMVQHLEDQINELQAAMLRLGLTDTERRHLRLQADALRGARTILQQRAS